MIERTVHPGQFGSIYSDSFKHMYTSDYGSARVSPEGYVSNVLVSHDRRGEGHGTRLMSQITADADRMGKHLTLHARPELHDWYGRMGFQVTGEDRFGESSLPRLERRPRAAR